MDAPAVPNKYFVGGFPMTTSNEELAAAFADYGQVVEAKCMTRGGVGRGFGFVTFAEVPDPSLLLGGVVVNGNVVSVKEALPDPAVVPPALRVPIVEPFKFFIGGLPKSCTNNDLYTTFAPFGVVKEAMVQTNTDGSGRGFGFVTFLSQPADSLFQISVEIHGKEVSVKECVPQETLQNRKIFVSGLGTNIDEAMLMSYFTSYGTIVDTQVIRDKNTGVSRGFGFVVFQEEEECLAALQNFPLQHATSSVQIRRAEPKGARDARAELGAAGADPSWYGHDPSMGYYGGHPSGGGTVSDYILRQKLAAEQQRRVELERRLAMYEQGASYGGPWRRGGGKGGFVSRYQPY